MIAMVLSSTNVQDIYAWVMAGFVRPIGWKKTLDSVRPVMPVSPVGTKLARVVTDLIKSTKKLTWVDNYPTGKMVNRSKNEFTKVFSEKLTGKRKFDKGDPLMGFCCEEKVSQMHMEQFSRWDRHRCRVRSYERAFETL